VTHAGPRHPRGQQRHKRAPAKPSPRPEPRARQAPFARPRAVLRIRVRVGALDERGRLHLEEIGTGKAFSLPTTLGESVTLVLPIETGDECWVVLETEKGRKR